MWNDFDKDDSQSARFQCNLDSIGKKLATKIFFRSCTFQMIISQNTQNKDAIWTQSTENSNENFLLIFHVPLDTVQKLQNIVRILIRCSRICHYIVNACNPTRQKQLSFPECDGTLLTVGMLGRTIRTIPDP